MRDFMDRACASCGADISHKRSDAKVCSRSCYTKKYWNENKADIDRSEYMREYAVKNKGKLKEYQSGHYEKNREQYRLNSAEYYQKNSEEIKARVAKYQSDNAEKVRDCNRSYVTKNLQQHLWKSAKKRACEKGVPFSISVEDVAIPDVCPVLGIKLERGRGRPVAGSPSIDRIKPHLGYVVGNISVISHRANRIKNDADATELLAVACWLIDLSGGVAT